MPNALNKGAGSEASLPVTLRSRRSAPELLFPKDSVKNQKSAFRGENFPFQKALSFALAVFLHHADRLCADALFFALKAESFRRRCLDVHARKGQFERIRHILPHLRNVGE